MKSQSAWTLIENTTFELLTPKDLILTRLGLAWLGPFLIIKKLLEIEPAKPKDELSRFSCSKISEANFSIFTHALSVALLAR